MWFLPTIPVVLQNHLFNSQFYKDAFCSPCFIFRMILFGLRSHFLHKEASSLDSWFDQEIFLNHDILSFLVSNRNKMYWKGKRLHNRMTRLDIQAQFSVNFWLHFFLQFPKTYFFANAVSLRRFWFSLSLKKSLPAENAETFDYVSYLLAFEIVSWNWQLYFSNLLVEWLVLVEGFILKFLVWFFPWKSN